MVNGHVWLLASQKKCEQDGFPTIAELAFKKDWAPLQNLCRRRVVKEEEVNKKFQDKTAFQWALHHGELGLAKELAYLLVRCSQ
jgi:hypothetical protein